MQCPGCGDKDAQSVALFTGVSYLCANQICRYFDMDHAVGLVAKAFGGHLEESSDELAFEWPDAPLGLTD